MAEEKKTQQEEFESEEAIRRKGDKMTVEEAGHLGGQRVKELIEEGKQQEQGK